MPGISGFSGLIYLRAQFPAIPVVIVSGSDDANVAVTDAGKQLHARIRSANLELTERLWGDLPPEDLATAAEVLATVLERANAELAGGARQTRLTDPERP